MSTHRADTGVGPIRRIWHRRALLGFGLGLLCGALVAGALALRNLSRVRSISGFSIGQLPAGVSPDQLNVLVVTLDTTRADRLGCYGFGGIATPTIDRLAAEGTLFREAISPVPLTLPAHSSIFTGRIPPSHGVRDNGGFYLDPREHTLATLLHAKGFATGAFVGAYVLDSKWGLNQGFDYYFDRFDLSRYKTVSLGDISRPAVDVANEALKWLDSERGRRFFAWIHFYDPHSPYDPPEPFKTEYADHPYLGEIAYVDSQLARIVGFLEARGLLDRTIVVVLGDHGESLGEHGEGTHAFFIYEATLHVPLIIRTPYSTLRGQSVKAIVRSVDVMPTILDLLRIRHLERIEGGQGESLVGLMTGATREDHAVYSESFYPRYHFGWSELRSLRAGRFKYVAAPEPELYDLETDPHELRNLYPIRRGVASGMAAALAEIERSDERRPGGLSPGAIDPEARQRLAALGYVGSFTAAPAPGTAHADPKRKIGLFNLMTRAREQASGRRQEEAIADLEHVVREDPQVVDAWFMLGNAYFVLGQYGRALDQFKHTLALKPDDDLAIVNMANTYLRMGRVEEAIAGYRRFLEFDPRNAQVRYQLGQLYLDRGDAPAAGREFAAALTVEAHLAAAHIGLGVLAINRGDLAAAERDLREALAEKPDVWGAHYNLAQIRERQGQPEAAIAEYRDELRIHGDNYKAHFNLGKLYEQLRRHDEQLAEFKAAVVANPEFAEGYLFLAKLYLDLQRDYDEAIALARRGLALAPTSEYAPLGHYVLADIFSRQHRFAEAAEEVAKGRSLEAAHRAKRS